MEQKLEQKSKNNYTSLPQGVNDWNAYEEWITYDNTEFIADQNFAECWGDVDRLKEKFGNVSLININSGPAIRPEAEAKRYCFGFDYAIACITDAQKRKLKRLIDAYRNPGIPKQRKTTPVKGITQKFDVPDLQMSTSHLMKLLIPVIDEIKEFPHVEDHFS